MRAKATEAARRERRAASAQCGRKERNLTLRQARSNCHNNSCARGSCHARSRQARSKPTNARLRVTAAARRERHAATAVRAPKQETDPEAGAKATVKARVSQQRRNHPKRKPRQARSGAPVNACELQHRRARKARHAVRAPTEKPKYRGGGASASANASVTTPVHEAPDMPRTRQARRELPSARKSQRQPGARGAPPRTERPKRSPIPRQARSVRK